MRRWLINFQLSTATPKGQQTQGHCTSRSRSSCESCFSPQRSLETRRSQRCARPDTTAPACPGLCMTPCTGKEDCLLQTPPGDEMESWRKMAVQGEDLETEKQRTEWPKAKAIHALPLEATDILWKLTKTEAEAQTFLRASSLMLVPMWLLNQVIAMCSQGPRVQGSCPGNVVPSTAMYKMMSLLGGIRALEVLPSETGPLKWVYENEIV